MIPDRHLLTVIHRKEHAYYLSFGTMTFEPWMAFGTGLKLCMILFYNIYEYHHA